MEIDGKQLPEGWRWMPLGEAAIPDKQLVHPGTDTARKLPYLSMEHVESNSGRILKEPLERLEDEGNSTNYHFTTDHVLYGKLRPYLNKVAEPDFEGRCTTELVPLLPSRETDKRYLALVLRRQEIVDAAMKGRTGARMPRANMRELLKEEIPLPRLPEQKRIAAILTEQLAAVEQARKASLARLEAAHALPAAYLREVFETDEAKGWPVLRLGDISQVSGGIQKTPARKPVHHFRRYLTVRNVQRGYLDFSQVEQFEITEAELERYRLEDKDLLIVEGNGSPSHIGRNALFVADGQEWIHQNHIIRVRIDHNKCLPEFASAYLNSEGGKAQMLEKAETTSGLYTLSTSKVKALGLPVPPIPFQELSIQALHKHREQITQIDKSTSEENTAIDRLPASLLRQAFSGAL